MQIYSQILALCFFHAHAWGAYAFIVKPTKTSPLALSISAMEDTDGFPILPGDGPPEEKPMFPLNPPMVRIEGGETVRTYQMPPWSERVQYELRTNGRPLKAIIELWLGPLRKTHTLDMNVENGDETPVRATLKFKKGPQVLRIRTSSSTELPVMAGVTVPSAERSAELAAATEKLFNESPKVVVQGGSTEGGGGAIRTFQIEPNCNAIQLLVWSINTGRKSFRAYVELLHGPNNKKQVFNLQCGGGSQPYHAVFQTPGPGWELRIQNKKFMEDGLFEVAVVPFEMGNAGPSEELGLMKQWWQ